jgi:phosphoglycolate phosphatase
MAAIIFDFDGTIADSFDYIVDLLAKEAKIPPLDAGQRAELRGLSMAAIGRRFGHSWVRLFWLFLRGRRKMKGSIRDVKPFDGVTEVIQKLHGEGHELFILSSNSVRNIRIFLRHNQLHRYFLEMYGGIGLFGKAPALRKLLRDNNLDRSDALYIGDETRDIQAAQSIDLRIVAVTWGFARLGDLENQRPTALAHSPAELLSVLEEL